MTLKTYRRRAIWQQPGRAILTIASIVIGVAATVAIAIVANTSRDAYKQMFATVIGKAQLEVVSANVGGFDGSIQAEIEQIPGVQAAVPMLKRYSVLYLGSPSQNEQEPEPTEEPAAETEQPSESAPSGESGEAGERPDQRRKVRLQILGIDTERDRLIRDYIAREGRAIREGNEAMVDSGFAESLGIKIDDEIKLLTNSGIRSFTVVGLWEARGGATITQAGLIYIPLPEAQKYYRTRKNIDMIQLVLDPDAKTDEIRQLIEPTLPAGVQVRSPTSETQLMKETLFATEEGLKLASLFCLLLASFIILNTFFMNISERRRQLAILRAIGASRAQVIQAILGESLGMGLIGTLCGMLSGLGLAMIANRIITQLFEVPVPPMELTWEPFVQGPLVGFGMALLGSFIPAWNAGKISPLEGLDRVSRGDLTGSSRSILVSGFLMLVAAAIGIYGVIAGKLPQASDKYFGVVMLIGIVFLYEFVVVPSAPVVTAILKRLVGVEAQLAMRQILRHRIRTNLTAGVVFVAASTGIGLGYAILDNVEDVRQWYRQAIRGDYFVRAMIPDFNSGRSADLPAELGVDLREVRGIRNLETVSFTENQIGEQKVIVICRDFVDPEEIPFDAIEGDPRQLVAELKKGKVVVGSVLALRLEIKVGDMVKLNTVDGPRELEVAGITNDYLVGGLSLYMHRDSGQKLLGITGCDGYVVFAEPGNRELRDTLQKICNKHGVLLHTVGQIREIVEEKVRGLNVMLWALVILMFVVAAFGVVNTLTMNVLEQTRELAILRIVAMTRSQTRRTILCQAVIIATVGVLPGVAAGVMVAYLINVLAGPSIGHPVDFGSHPYLLTLALIGGFCLTVGAALLPARRASNVNVAQALHYE